MISESLNLKIGKEEMNQVLLSVPKLMDLIVVTLETFDRQKSGQHLRHYLFNRHKFYHNEEQTPITDCH